MKVDLLKTLVDLFVQSPLYCDKSDSKVVQKVDRVLVKFATNPWKVISEVQ